MVTLYYAKWIKFMRASVLSIRHLHVNFIFKSYFLALGVNDNFLSNVVRLNTLTINRPIFVMQMSCKKKKMVGMLNNHKHERMLIRKSTGCSKSIRKQTRQCWNLGSSVYWLKTFDYPHSSCWWGIWWLYRSPASDVYCEVVQQQPNT